jgi:hypothetical protein
MAARAAGALLVATIITGCTALPELPEMIRGDWQPPILVATEARDTDRIALVFDEEVALCEAALDPDHAVVASRWHDGALKLHIEPAMTAGTEYWIDATVEDVAGNISSILVSAWGLNTELPEILINEFVCEGSGTRPDWVELRVLGAGNMGGMTLYEGSPGIWDSRYVFGPMEVSAGDYLVVHFKPQVIPEEIDEYESPLVSGGYNATPQGYDFWVRGGDGIPNSTGALTLCDWPGGPIRDAVLYTTKRYDAAHPLRGFGLESQLQIFEEVVANGAWSIAGEIVVPEDALDPEDSTATRSINRESAAADTDSAADWHIAPTSGATPGGVNTDERY